MTAGIVLMGLLYGMVPLSLLVVIFRLADAVTGARGVRVHTSDLTEAFSSLAAVWLIGMLLYLAIRRLRGVARTLAERIAVGAACISLLGCVFIIAPFRAAVFVAVLLALDAYAHARYAARGAAVVSVLMGVSMFLTLHEYLLARAVTVGSFLLFAGAVSILVTCAVVYFLDRADK